MPGVSGGTSAGGQRRREWGLRRYGDAEGSGEGESEQWQPTEGHVEGAEQLAALLLHPPTPYRSSMSTGGSALAPMSSREPRAVGGSSATGRPGCCAGSRAIDRAWRKWTRHGHPACEARFRPV